MAVELATAYISLVPSMRGLQENLQTQLKASGVSAAAGKSGEDVGNQIGAGVTRTARPAAEKAGQDTGRGFADHFGAAASGLAGAVGFGFVGAGIAEVGSRAVEAASAETEAQARLANALQQTGSSYSANRDQIESTVASMEKLGFSGDQTQNALARLVTAVKDPAKAMQDLQIAANLAAARHIDLDSAATLVGRVATGNTGILARYGITLNVASGNAKALQAAHDAVTKAQQHLITVQDSLAGKTKLTAADQDRLRLAHLGVSTAQAKLASTTSASGTALSQLGQQFGGAAQAQASTFGGKIHAMGAQMEDTFAKLGVTAAPAISQLFTSLQPVLAIIVQLIPPLATLISVIVTGLTTAIRDIVGTVMDWVHALEQGQTWAIAIAAALGVFLLALAPLLVPLLGVVAGVWASVAAFVAQAIAVAAAYAPFILIALALAAVAAGVVFLVKLIIDHWNDITGFFVHTWDTVWPFLRTWGPVALAVLLPFIGIPLLIFQHWSQIEGFIVSIASTVWGFLRTWGPVALAVLLPFIGIPLLIFQHWNQIAGFLDQAWSAAYRTVAGWVGSIANVVGQIPGFISGLAGRMLAAGQAIMGALWNGVKSVVSGAVDVGKGIVNDIIRGLNTILPHSLAIGFSAGPISVHQTIPLFPSIPYLAAGGLTAGPLLAAIGDNPSGHELVMPLDSPATTAALAAALTSAIAAMPAMATAGAPAGPAVQIGQAIFQDQADLEMLMRQADFALLKRRL